MSKIDSAGKIPQKGLCMNRLTNAKLRELAYEDLQEISKRAFFWANENSNYDAPDYGGGKGSKEWHLIRDVVKALMNAEDTLKKLQREI